VDSCDLSEQKPGSNLHELHISKNPKKIKKANPAERMRPY